jgi:transcriptional regulatory protein RtcR
MKPCVAIGCLGTVLDTGKGPDRWEKWRPSVALCQFEDLLISRFELLTQSPFKSITDTVVADIHSVSPETTVNVHNVAFDDVWDFENVYAALHDWARAYPFKPDEEDYLIHITTGSHVTQICLFLLTEARYLPGKLIQTAPPRKHSAPPGSYGVIDLDLSKYDRLASRFGKEMTESLSFLKSGIETRNAAFNALIERIERVAINSSAPLLLMGPTGSGKSNLARRIYQLKKSRRQVSGPFVEMNCATLRGDAAMSALFGHKRGAFTGAIQDRPGLLRAADKGVLFLDEVGELGADEQAMLLRALEEKTFLPVGADKEVHSDFQLIAGTNRDLAADVRAGRFREDLLARINLWTFKLPALRDRPEDIEPNLRFELEQFASRFGTNVTFNLEARQRFLAFATSGEALWSGNFRDLNAAVTRMATLAGGGRITVAVVEDEIERLRQAWAPLGASDAQQTLVEFFEADRLARLDPFDRCQLAHVIDTCRKAKSLSDAGRTLFAATRQLKTRSNDADRLRKYLSRFDLDWSRIHPPRI